MACIAQGKRAGTRRFRWRRNWSVVEDDAGFGCAFLDVDLDGQMDLAVANGHIDETVRNIRGNVGYAQAPQLF